MKFVIIMTEDLETNVDDFEVDIGVAALAPPEAYRIISDGLMGGKTGEQIERELNVYREKPEYS